MTPAPPRTARGGLDRAAPGSRDVGAGRAAGGHDDGGGRPTADRPAPLRPGGGASAARGALAADEGRCSSSGGPPYEAGASVRPARGGGAAVGPGPGGPDARAAPLDPGPLLSGTLHGVGVGPGDPDLMTVRARRLIEGAAVVAYPHPEGREGLARSIAAPFLPAGVAEIAMPLPMTPERAPAQAAYDRGAARVAEALARTDVVVLCEGDPMLYGSFMYLAARLAPRARVRVTPGVAAVCACAAAAGLPLAARDEPLTLLPATLPEAEIARLARAGNVAVMKLGRHVAKVRRALAAAGLAAVYVERATTVRERVLPLAEAPDPAPYFSMALARRPDPWL